MLDLLDNNNGFGLNSMWYHFPAIPSNVTSGWIANAEGVEPLGVPSRTGMAPSRAPMQAARYRIPRFAIGDSILALKNLGPGGQAKRSSRRGGHFGFMDLPASYKHFFRFKGNQLAEFIGGVPPKSVYPC